MKRMFAVLALVVLATPAALAQELTFRHFAGSDGGPGAIDGPAARARIGGGGGVAVDAGGNVYFSDPTNHTIRRMTAAGVVTTLAGLAGQMGSADGRGSAAQFHSPDGVALDAAGNVYVADTGNHTIRKVTPQGIVTTLAGKAGEAGAADGVGPAARFSGPGALTTEPTGSLVVADRWNGRLRRIALGGTVTTVIESGGAPAQFYDPGGVTADSAGNVYVVQAGSQCVILRLTPQGVRSVFAGTEWSPGRDDGPVGVGKLGSPMGVVADSVGGLWVADATTIRRVTPDGVLSTVAGIPFLQGNEDGTAPDATFMRARAVALDGAGGVVVLDAENPALRRVTPLGVVTTIAGAARKEGTVDGLGALARFGRPRGVVFDATGNAYVADTRAIRKVTPDGSVTTFAQSACTDGICVGPRFVSPSGVAAVPGGDLIVADPGAGTVITVSSTGVLTTLAGLAGEQGFADGVGTAARFSSPFGVAVDAAGNAYVADTGNDRIRKVTPTGVVTTLAGGGSSDEYDGQGSDARFIHPEGVAVDGAGVIWVADTGAHAIRRVTADGFVTTVAGFPKRSGSADGSGLSARFFKPTGIAVDAAGDLLVVDGGNGTIRRVTPAGLVTTPAGHADPETSPGSRPTTDGTGDAARFDGPYGIAVGPSGRVLVSEPFAHALRIGAPALPDVATIDAPWGPLGTPRHLGTSPATATSWRWEAIRIQAGSAASLSAETVRDPVFTPDVDGLFVFRLTATGAAADSVTTVALAAGDVAPTVAVCRRAASVCSGSHAEIRADLTGAPPWSLVWSDGFNQVGVPSSPATRMVGPDAMTTYTVTSVSDAHGPGTSGGSVVVSTGTPPTAIVSGGGTTCLGREALLTVDVTGDDTVVLAWSDGATEIVRPFFGHQRRVRPLTTTTYSLLSATTASCAGTASGSATITTIPLPTATVSGSTTICAGQSAVLRADLTGTGPWEVTWSDGFVSRAVFASPALRAVRPSSTTTYSVTKVADARCQTDGTGSATVAVLPQAPPASSVTATSPVAPGAAGLVASVPDAGPGTAYEWTLSNGEITSGQGTPAITYTAGGVGLYAIRVTITPPGGCVTTGAAAVRVGVDPAPPLHFAHLAGSPGGGGWFDGPASAARFASPISLARDAAGNVYVADWSNATIRRMSSGGTVATLAGVAGSFGYSDGTRSGAQFRSPTAMVSDSLGNLFVADYEGHTIRRISPSGTVTTIAGAAGVQGSADGPGADARFKYPQGLAIDAAQNLFVADSGNCTIRRITPQGVVSTFAGVADQCWASDGDPGAGRFLLPTGLALDDIGSLWVVDQFDSTIRRVSPTGAVATVAGASEQPGSSDGTGYRARFWYPFAIAYADGAAWVADTGNATIRRVSPAGDVTTVAGFPRVAGASDGTGSAARFRSPAGILAEGAGSFLVADAGNHAIRRVTAGGVVTTIAGKKTETGADDGLGAAARFESPSSVAVDADGNSFVADARAHTIRRVTSAGEVTTLAGLAGSWGAADGTGSAARFNTPSAVACDPAGNVYVADRGNHTIRRVTPSGVVSTLAGHPGYPGSEDGTGAAAGFDDPYGVAVDANGNVLVADRDNQTIRQVTPEGIVTTWAGRSRAQGSADGPRLTATFRWPRGVAVDTWGNAYVADTENQTIRKVTNDGTVSTLAGRAGSPGSEDGVGADARFYWPTDIAADGAGNLWVVDSGNELLRQVTPAGVVTTVAGSRGLPGGVDGTSTAAQLDAPTGVAVGFGGEVVAVDSGNAVVRVGRASLPDTATIDASTGAVGMTRQLGVSPQTATTWLWEVVRAESGSTAALSSSSIPSPTFTPDLPGLYRFRLTATGAAGRSITIVSLAVDLPPPTAVLLGAPVEVCEGMPVDLEVRLTGTPPWEVVWSDGFRHTAWTSGLATRSVTPSTTTTYSLASVTDLTGPGSVAGGREVQVKARPAKPVITTSPTVGAQSPGRVASVASHPGSTYEWWISNGYVTAGAGTAQVEFTAISPGMAELHVVEKSQNGCASEEATATVTVLPVGSSLLFYPITPCRLFDSRDPDGETLGNPVPGGGTTGITIDGACGIPETALALAANVTVTQPVAPGFVVVYSTDGTKPGTSTVHFGAGRTRASFTLLTLARSTPRGFLISNESAGSTHVILDVTGYFQ